MIKVGENVTAKRSLETWQLIRRQHPRTRKRHEAKTYENQIKLRTLANNYIINTGSLIAKIHFTSVRYY